MNEDSRILVTGHLGLVGSAVVRVLEARGFRQIITVGRQMADLRLADQVKWLFSSYRPEFVFHCAAKVGGIVANRDHAAEFALDNILIQTNVIENAREYKVKKLLFLGSACAYPKQAECPIKETALLTGPLEPTNECYALAKIFGIRMCQAYWKQYGCRFISAMPTNLYGLRDHYDLENSHVLPGMLRRFHEAKQTERSDVLLWGTGRPTREFLYADDLAEACILLMQKYSHPDLINIGGSREVTLRELAGIIAQVTGFTGKILWDPSNPDGTPRRCLDSSRIRALGWIPRTRLKEGIERVYEDFQKQLCQPH